MATMVRKLKLLIVISILITLMMKVEAATHWGTFEPHECVLPGYRQYESRLWDIKGSWEAACASMEARVGSDKVYFKNPDKCEKRGFLSTGGMWGLFYVRDETCDPCWGSFRNDGCVGRGYRKYSSVLQNIKDNGDWETWCKAAPAVVHSTYFSTPTNCSKQTFLGIGISEWGEFWVYDPACPLTAAVKVADDVNSTSAVNLMSSDSTSTGSFDPWANLKNPDDYTCGVGGGGEDPPNPPRKITDIPGAMIAMRREKQGSSDEFTYALVLYLLRNLFRIISPTRDGRGPAVNTSYYAVNGGTQLTLTPNEPTYTRDYVPMVAIYVPMVPYDLLRQNNRFPARTLAVIQITGSQTTLICTRELTGCCLVFGWNNANSRLYMGHVEPTENANRADIVNYIRESANALFPERVDQRVWFGGDDAAFGYGHERVNVIGIVRPNRIWIILQSRSSSNPNQVRHAMLMDFQRL